MLDIEGGFDWDRAAGGGEDRRPRREIVVVTVDGRGADRELASHLKDAFLGHAKNRKRPESPNMALEVELTTGAGVAIIRMPWRMFYPTRSFFDAVMMIPGVGGVYYWGRHEEQRSDAAAAREAAAARDAVTAWKAPRRDRSQDSPRAA